MRKWMFSLIVLVAIMAIAIGSQIKAQDLSLNELPVGDGKVSDQPNVGYVFACNSNFRTGGARHTGSWFHGDTWSPLEKPHVQGSVL
jgi:hypothetical protein